VCLLHIPVNGKLIRHNDQITYEYDIKLLAGKLRGGFVGILWLKRLYEKYLSRANEFEEPANSGEEEAERDLTRDCCILTFMLYLVRCTILSNKNIKVVWLEGMQNSNRVHEWSWDGMGLTNLYHQLSEANDPGKGSIDEYLSLRGRNLICCVSYYKRVDTSVFVYRCVDII